MSILIVGFVVAGILLVLGTANINPLPAKSSAARAYNTFNVASFTIGTESADTINVAVQLKDARGKAIAQVAKVDVYLASDSGGATLTPTATTSALAIGTNGKLLGILTTGKVCSVISDASGRFDLNIIQTATPTYYLVVVMPDGSISVSSAITFA